MCLGWRDVIKDLIKMYMLYMKAKQLSPNNEGNKNNSFDRNRTDPNGLRYKEEYDKL
jgi:hypothetical protein